VGRWVGWVGWVESDVDQVLGRLVAELVVEAASRDVVAEDRQGDHRDAAGTAVVLQGAHRGLPVAATPLRLRDDQVVDERAGPDVRVRHLKPQRPDRTQLAVN